MTRIIPKLLTSLFAFGCGSAAMASPQHGQWTDPSTSTTEDAWRSGPNAPAQSQGAQGWSDQSSSQAQDQNPYQGQYQNQDQSQSQNQGQNQGADEDTVEAQAQDSGQAHLGVVVMALTPELRQFFRAPVDRGVLIARVEPGSAASRAGIQVGDVLVRVGPRQVRSGDDVIQALSARQSGRVRIAVIRQGRLQRMTAMLPDNQSPSEDQNDRL